MSLVNVNVNIVNANTIFVFIFKFGKERQTLLNLLGVKQTKQIIRIYVMLIDMRGGVMLHAFTWSGFSIFISEPELLTRA